VILSAWHEDSITEYPSLLKDNLVYRTRVLDRAEEDPVFAGMLCELFKADPEWAICTFFWTFDPRNNTKKRNAEYPKDMPFIFFDYQRKTFHTLIKRILVDPDDVLIDKSRDMGATWLVLAAILWCWVAIPGFQALCGSRKEDYVDNGMIDSHFGKIRYMFYRLPPFLRPPTFNRKAHDNSLRLYNPANESAVQGEATNKDFSRQGRYNVIFMDEFAAWEIDKEAWVATGDSSPCRIPVSTPKGRVNEFAEIRHSGDTEIISLHWTLHPEKSRGMWYDDENKKWRSPWYDNECRRRKGDAEAIAQELDMDYLASGRPVFDIKICAGEVAKAKKREDISYGDLAWTVPPEYNRFGDCINKAELEVEFVRKPYGSVAILKFPSEQEDYRNKYVAAADTAEGLEQNDWDVAYIADRSQSVLDTVAELRGHWSPHTFALEAAKLCIYYGRAPIWPEKNNHGHAVIEAMFKVYNNIGHEKFFDCGPMIQFSSKLGWVTGGISKPIMIDALDKAIRDGEYRNPFTGFWKEAQTFVKDKKGGLSAQNKGKNGKFFDDRVITAAILIQANRYLPAIKKLDKTDKEVYLQEEKDKKVREFANRFCGVKISRRARRKLAEVY